MTGSATCAEAPRCAIDTRRGPQRSDDATEQNPGTIWGLTAQQLHDRYWAARGIRVVRRGSRFQPRDGTSLFMLLEPEQLVLFTLPPAVRKLQRRRPRVLQLSLHDDRAAATWEQADVTDDGRFLGVRRSYDTPVNRTAAVHLTNNADIARQWRDAADHADACRQVRALAPLYGFLNAATAGRLHDGQSPDGQRLFLLDLVACWSDLEDLDPRLRCVKPGVWVHESAVIHPSARLFAPLWIGAGVEVERDAVVVGPCIVADQIRTTRPADRYGALRPVVDTRHFGRLALTTTRVFDLCFSVAALALTAPLWPIIAAAIWVDDGWPILFAHRRQTVGGREFRCLKFRTMRNDAEAIKAQLASHNVCDGPQFYIENDPRETRVGRLLRRVHLDELPQFLNVMAGDMSVVGPRPSPESENRFCPAWRATRLSVKPGITGLWQVRRTRQPGADFQEWIRYDTEYVRRRNWWMDIRIIVGTIRRMLPI